VAFARVGVETGVSKHAPDWSDFNLEEEAIRARDGSEGEDEDHREPRDRAMRLKRVHVPARSIGSRAFARRTGRWQIPASAVAAFAFGCVVAAAAVGGEAAGAPLGSASRAPAALGTGVVDPAVRPYLDPKLLQAVPVGSGDVSKPVRMVLTSAGGDDCARR
jgi:hypothetical protein